MSKLRHHASSTVLRSVYFCLVYLHLHNEVSSWGNAACESLNKLQVQQNCIIKIITKSSFIWTKLRPIYNQMNLLKIPGIYKLKVLNVAHTSQLSGLGRSVWQQDEFG